MTRNGRKPCGAMYITPGHVHWIVGAVGRQGLELEAGGRFSIEPVPFPPPTSCFHSVVKQHHAAWSLVVPLPVRATAAHLPALPPKELAQGARWEAERSFRLGDMNPVYEFELFPRASAAAGEETAMLLGLRTDAIGAWMTWASDLPFEVERLEPAFSAMVRTLATLTTHVPAYSGAIVFVHGGEGSSGIVIFQRGTPLVVRSLTAASGLPLAGERGKRILAETLLYCEDRYPRLELEALVGMGTIEPGWLEEAARTCQLSLVPPPSPPVNLPRELESSGTWHVLYGGLIGFA